MAQLKEGSIIKKSTGDKADKFNASGDVPAGLNFVVKP